MSVPANKHDTNGTAAMQLHEAGQVVSLAEARNRRRRATIQGVIMLAIGCVIAQYSGHRIIGVVVLGLAVVVLVSGWFVPSVSHRIEKLGDLVARGFGVATTWVLLVPFYYLCFGCGRVIFAFRGRDPLRRKFPGRKPTYWVTRQLTANVDQYKKRF
jgi:hypothetical protein